MLLEDDPHDAKLILRHLESFDPGSDVVRVDDEPTFVAAMASHVVDVIVSDHALAGFDALAALRVAQRLQPGVPFVLVSGAFTPAATACLKAGALEFVLKSELDRLGPVVRDALEKRASLRTLTARQREVLRLLSLGRSTRQIAAALGVSIKTVETHRSDLMRRLDIHDLAGLVRYAVGMGLVST